MSKFFLPAEKAAKEQSENKSTPIARLLDDIHDDQQLRDAPQWSDGNKLRDGIMGRAADRMISYAAQYRVKPDELERKTVRCSHPASS